MSENIATKRVINFIYVDGERSPYSDSRGFTALSTFAKSWRRMAEVNATFTSFKTLRDIGVPASVNTIWLDNVRDLATITAVAAAKAERGDTLSVIYALDEYVWEAPGGRAAVLADVRAVERAIAISDRVVVPNAILSSVASQVLGAIPEGIEVLAIPTFPSAAFFPTQANLLKSKAGMGFTPPKPKVLVKGIEIPANVQRFIERNYKDMDITISTICELTPKLAKHVTEGKVRHIRHWSNPDVNFSNQVLNHALERDMRFDFTVICKPEDLTGNYYELSLGDEDVVFAVASGSLPVAIAAHVGYDEKSSYYASGLCISATDGPTVLEGIISEYKHPDKWNLAMSKSIALISERIAGSPAFLNSIYRAFVGSAAFEAEIEFLKQNIEAKKQAAEQAEAEPPKNVVKF